MRINCIIVEDEPLALERIQTYVGKLPFLHLVAAFDNSMEALVFIKTNPPHLIFLDINMPRKSGPECLSEIKQNEKLKDIPVVMFSTSNSWPTLWFRAVWRSRPRPGWRPPASDTW